MPHPSPPHPPAGCRYSLTPLVGVRRVGTMLEAESHLGRTGTRLGVGGRLAAVTPAVVAVAEVEGVVEGTGCQGTGLWGETHTKRIS